MDDAHGLIAGLKCFTMSNRFVLKFELQLFTIVNRINHYGLCPLVNEEINVASVFRFFFFRLHFGR